MNNPNLVWLRQDLRLHDHRALAAAAADAEPVVLVYVLDETTPGAWAPGAASRWWLHHSLLSLQASIESRGGRLILRRGPALQVLRELVEQIEPDGLYFSRCYEPQASALESSVHEQLSEYTDVRRFGGTLLFEPEQVATKSGTPFKVFTPFWRACQAQMATPHLHHVDGDIVFAQVALASDELADWELLPVRPDWAGGLRDNWTPGEDGAHERLADFVEHDMADYAEGRDRPDRRGTSRLSPHLHFGELSPQQVWHAVRQHTEQHGDHNVGGAAFLREIGWREFSQHLLFNFPTLPDAPFRPQFEAFAWRDDDDALRAWQRGQTGYPVVDAGMRELWHCGWMHNRVRMIAASLLIKHLLIPWQQGEAWFWDTLVDADLGSNASGWQWVAGSGADASPYFRIFNPVLQGKKFDPQGAYVRRWIPEIAALPDAVIHAPWTADAAVLKSAGVVLGKTYPQPIVDHAFARQRALDAYARVRSAAAKPAD